MAFQQQGSVATKGQADISGMGCHKPCTYQKLQVNCPKDVSFRELALPLTPLLPSPLTTWGKQESWPWGHQLESWSCPSPAVALTLSGQHGGIGPGYGNCG